MTGRTHRACRRRWRRRSVLSTLLLGVFVWVGAGPATPQPTDDLFERHEIVTGSAKSQTVLTGRFLNGPAARDSKLAQLAVVSLDDNDNRRLRIYVFAGEQWTQKLDAKLRRAVLFVDVADIDGRDRLITYERVVRRDRWDRLSPYESGRLNWFDPDSATERALMEIPTTYNTVHDHEGSPTQPGADIPRVDVTRDLNHDGRDDLVMPAVDGFWVSTQLSDGSFADAVKLGPPEPYADESTGKLNPEMGSQDGSRTYGDVGITAATLPIYLSRVHEMDYDRDGRTDLVFWNEDHFDFYTQDESGRFDSTPRTFDVSVPFDSDGIYTRMFEFTDKGVISLLFGVGKKTSRTVLHSFHDLNGDGVADLVTLTLTGRSMLKQRSVYEVHFGTSTPDGIVFARDGNVIRPRVKGGGTEPWGYASQRFEDFDGDGQLEITFRAVRMGLGGMGRALVGNSVPMDLEFYRLADGAYPGKPTAKLKIRRFAPFAGIGNVFLPPVLMGDVNGDGRADLLVGRNPRELHVLLGVPGPGLLAQKPLKVAVALPSDERRVWLSDLNQDGKQDVLVHQAPTSREPTRLHRLTTLIAR